MDQVKIIRIESHPEYGTFGVLLINGESVCVTLERYWLNNRPNLSCIYTGQFICKRFNSKEHGETFRVLSVYGRYGILFHTGNLMQESRGCILLGEKFGVLYGKRCIRNSKLAFKEFMHKLIKTDQFKLSIVTSY